MTAHSKIFLPLLLAVFIGIGLTSCASSEERFDVSGVQIYDPFEDTNRAIFKFNEGVDDFVIHPVAKGYRAVVPEPARDGFSNFLANLRSPVNFANQLLQGDVDGAGNVALRAVVNTLVGLGGLFDVAAAEGIEPEIEDFGQTLAVWGVDHGPYIVAPIFGPSSLRDYVGIAVDSFADPLRFYLNNIDEEGLYFAKVGADYLVLRESLVDVLEDLEASSIDYYAAVRSTYYQRREALVNDEGRGGSGQLPSIPDFDE